MRNLKYCFLTTDFYNHYQTCSEIEQKAYRPYAMVLVQYNGLDFAVPFRSHIDHEFAHYTDNEKTKGLDFSKAVPILSSTYIDTKKYPLTISKDERAALFNKAEQVENELRDYIEKYKKASSKQHILDNQRICRYSCLQYFHQEIGLGSK